MHLPPDAVANVCDAIEAMTRHAWELEASPAGSPPSATPCQERRENPPEAGGRGNLPDGVTVLSLEALQRRTIPDVLRLNTYEDGAGDPDPGDCRVRGKRSDAVPQRRQSRRRLSLSDKIALAMLASLGVLAALYAWEIELARQALEGAV